MCMVHNRGSQKACSTQSVLQDETYLQVLVGLLLEQVDRKALHATLQRIGRSLQPSDGCSTLWPVQDQVRHAFGSRPCCLGSATILLCCSTLISSYSTTMGRYPACRCP